MSEARGLVRDLALALCFAGLSVALGMVRFEVPGVPDAMEMVRILVKGHETVSRIAREFIPVAEEAGDDPTADMLTARCTVHDQTAWMLRSLLED